MNNIRARRALRLGFIVLAIDGVFYVVEMLDIASRLRGGTATGSSQTVNRIFGLTLFSAVRHGYQSEVTSATWVVPALLLIPIIVGVLTYFLWGNRPRPQQL